MTFAPLSLTGLEASRDTGPKNVQTARASCSSPALKPARLLLVAAAIALASGAPRKADFHICNNTGSRIGVAIGYKDAEGWTTEGWWNLSARSCETLLKGTLVARYYYIYAIDYDRGGEWSGHAFMCSRDKEFTIRGTQDCLARGFDRTGFFEVDTGEQRSWTVQLTETADDPQRRPLAPGAPMLPTPGRRAPSQLPASAAMRRLRRTKVVATLGPASGNPEHDRASVRGRRRRVPHQHEPLARTTACASWSARSAASSATTTGRSASWSICRGRSCASARSPAARCMLDKGATVHVRHRYARWRRNARAAAASRDFRWHPGRPHACCSTTARSACS